MSGLRRHTVVIHNQQHDKVSDGELHHIQETPNSMLPEFKLRFTVNVACRPDADRRVRFPMPSVAIAVFTFGAIMARNRSDVATDQVSIKFALDSAEKFEGHYQEDDADTTASKSSSGSDVPGLGEKACVDSIPVPQHLVARSASALLHKGEKSRYNQR